MATLTADKSLLPAQFTYKIIPDSHGNHEISLSTKIRTISYNNSDEEVIFLTILNLEIVSLLLSFVIYL